MDKGTDAVDVSTVLVWLIVSSLKFLSQWSKIVKLSSSPFEKRMIRFLHYAFLFLDYLCFSRFWKVAPTNCSILGLAL